MRFLRQSSGSSRFSGWLWSHVFLLSAVVCTVGCSPRKPIVTIDDWWNIDYAKNACEYRAAWGEPCTVDPVSELRDFETALRTSFSGDPACHEVILTGFGDPLSTPTKAASEASLKADWQLMFDFQPGASSEDWTMVRRIDSKRTMGRGTPKEVAHSICTVVTATGGLIVD